MILLKLLNYAAISAEGMTYAILFAEPQGDTAAGAAIAYGIEIILTFDDGMNKASLVTVP